MFGCEAVSASTTTTLARPRAGSSARAEVRDARRQWVAGARAASFEQSIYFRRAAADLTGAVRDGATPVSAYGHAAAQLRQLASLPETSDTPAQVAQATHDLAALNRFFDTTKLYD